jgi:hypothetical protein
MWGSQYWLQAAFQGARRLRFALTGIVWGNAMYQGTTSVVP